MYVYLTEQKENEFTDHLVLSVKVGYGKIHRNVMNLVEVYLNSQYSQTKAQNKVTVNNG